MVKPIKRKWTTEEDLVFLETIADRAGVLREIIDIVSKITGRRPESCRNRWYKFLYSKYDQLPYIPDEIKLKVQERINSSSLNKHLRYSIDWDNYIIKRLIELGGPSVVAFDTISTETPYNYVSIQHRWRKVLKFTFYYNEDIPIKDRKRLNRLIVKKQEVIRRSWTNEEDNILLDMVDTLGEINTENCAEVAEKLDRTTSAILNRYYLLMNKKKRDLRIEKYNNIIGGN